MTLLHELNQNAHLLHILSTQKGIDTPGITVLKHGEREYQRFFYILKGTATFQIAGGKTITAKETSLVYLPYDCTYVCSWSDCEKCEYITINFSIYSKYGDIMNLNQELCIAAFDSNGKYQHLLKRIHENWIAHVNTDFSCYSLFYETLCEIQKDMYDNQKDHESKIHKAIMYIENHCCENTPIDKLAKICNISPTALRVFFKKETGLSPVKYRNRVKLHKALNMLKYKDYSISEIAEILNFSDPYYFTKIFKEEFGLPPAKYKKTNFCK